MTELAEVFAKLRYGAGSDFSTSFRPAECALLLRALDDEFVESLVESVGSEGFGGGVAESNAPVAPGEVPESRLAAPAELGTCEYALLTGRTDDCADALRAIEEARAAARTPSGPQSPLPAQSAESLRTWIETCRDLGRAGLREAVTTGDSLDRLDAVFDVFDRQIDNILDRLSSLAAASATAEPLPAQTALDALDRAARYYREALKHVIEECSNDRPRIDRILEEAERGVAAADHEISAAAKEPSEPNGCPTCEGRGEVAATPGYPADGPMPCPTCAVKEPSEPSEGWRTGEPSTHGYYLAVWGAGHVSELWFNPDAIPHWWFTRGYTGAPRRGGLGDAVLSEVVAWMPMPELPDAAAVGPQPDEAAKP